MNERQALAALFAGRRLDQEPAGFVDWLVSRRLASEVAALPGLVDSGLARTSLRRLAVDRERTRAAAAERAPILARAGLALADAGIAAWLYKGEAFVRLTHGDPSRRPMADLDIVVQRAAQDRATAALVEAGFALNPLATDLHDVLSFPGPRGPAYPHGVPLELHGDVFPPPHPFELDLGGVLRRSRPSGVVGLRLPSVEDSLVLHAFHLLFFEQDGRKGLLALRDLALLAQRCDPRELRARADATGLAPVVATLLDRAAEMGADAPMAELRAGELPSRRRRWALALTLQELDESLARNEAEPPLRVLSRRLVAALWQPRGLDCLRALVRGLIGSGGASRRAKRYAAALARGGGES